MVISKRWFSRHQHRRRGPDKLVVSVRTMPARLAAVSLLIAPCGGLSSAARRDSTTNLRTHGAQTPWCLEGAKFSSNPPQTFDYLQRRSAGFKLLTTPFAA